MKINKLFTLLIFIIFGSYFPPSLLHSDMISDLKVKGNNRVSSEYIISLLSSKKGDQYDNIKLSDDIRSLYNTELFSNIEANFEKNVLTIYINENPLIYKIEIKGNKNIKKDTLFKEIISKEKATFEKKKIIYDIKQISNLYIQQGYLNAKVSYSTYLINKDLISITINITEGTQTTIGSIKFQGNRFFSDKSLKGVIFSKEKTWSSFLYGNRITYDKNKLLYDAELLKNYYLENGFPDFSVTSTSSSFSPIYGDFRIVYIVDEGERYKFGEKTLDIKVPELEKFENELLNKISQKTKRKWFAKSIINQDANIIRNFITSLGLQFVDVTPVYTYNKILQTVDVSFVIEKYQKTFINRIDIYGNTKTVDKVIRRELRFKEGDPLTSSNLASSTRALYKVDYFSSVNIIPKDTSVQNEKNVSVNVVEKGTAQIVASGGYSSVDKLSFNLSYAEKNFLGYGIDTDISLNFSEFNNSYSISAGNPYFLDKELYLGMGLYRKVLGNNTLLQGSKTSGDKRLLYNTVEQGMNLKLGYNITNDLKHSITYSLFSRNISNVKKDSGLAIKELEGNKIISSVKNIFYYDSTNNSLYPTSGIDLSLSADLAGFGGDIFYLKTIFKGMYYKELFVEDLVLSALFSVGNITGLQGQKPLIVDKFTLGGPTLRGFDIDITKNGIGPLDPDSREIMGGENMFRFVLQLDYPIPGFDDYSMVGHIFNDWGTVTDFSNNKYDTGKIRSSIGFGVTWRSPLGILSLDLGFPIIKEDYDQVSRFLFNIGTRY